MISPTTVADKTKGAKWASMLLAHAAAGLGSVRRHLTPLERNGVERKPRLESASAKFNSSVPGGNVHSHITFPDRVGATDGPPEAYLRIVNLKKSYEAVQVVRDLSLAVDKGEFVSLLGPSGCGKTTTLRIIAGFTAPSAGQIVLGGARIDQVPSHKRGATMVFQNYALFPHMTVAENVAFGLKMQKVVSAEIRTRVGEALEMVHLGQLGSRFPRELSGGQQQRVALARAIVLRPKLLLLDEPLSNLDAKLRKELRAEFLNIHRLSGTTTIFVTHDLEEAFSISDRVAVMNHGDVEQYADPVTIFTRPATPFVAEFVGHSNILSGKVESDEPYPVIRPNGLVIRVPSEFRSGEHVRLAIPAHLIEVTAEPGPADNCVPVEVENVSYLGATVHYQLSAGGLPLHAEVPVSPTRGLFARDDRVFACWRVADFIHLSGACR